MNPGLTPESLLGRQTLIGDELGELTALRTAERDARGAVAQHDGVVAVECGLQLFHVIEANQSGAVHAREIFGTEAFFDGGECFTQDETRSVDQVKQHVVVCGFGPYDVFWFQENDATFGFEGEAGGLLRRRRDIAEERFEAGVEVTVAPIAEELGGASEGSFETFAVERLQKVIDRADAEGINGELVMGRGEDDGRAMFRGQFVYHLKAVRAGHLHVEENDIGLFAFDRGDRVCAIAALADHLGGRLRAKQGSQAFARERFVIDDEDAVFGHGGRTSDLGCGRNSRDSSHSLRMTEGEE